MSFALLLLDSNYLTSARHAPKKWNVNYISIAGLDSREQALWDLEYGQDWSSVDSELPKELVVISKMLSTLSGFGYKLISSMSSNPRVAYKDNENNRECYIWTLAKSLDPLHHPLIGQQGQAIKTTGNATDVQIPTTSSASLQIPRSHCCCCKRSFLGNGEGIKNPQLGLRGLQMSQEIEKAFKVMSAKETMLRSRSMDNTKKNIVVTQGNESSQVLELNVLVNDGSVSDI